MEQTPDTPAAAPTRRRKGLLIVGLATLVIAGIGSVITWRLTARTVTAAAPAAAEPGMVAFEPFVANLADPGGTRFVRAGIRLVVDSADAARRTQSNELQVMRIRAAILDALSRETADRLVTADGKAALKQAITARVEPLLEHAKVIDVLFSDFVVQF